MIHNLDPVLIDLGLLQIRWYSLAYIFGIIVGWVYGKSIIKKRILNDLKTEKISLINQINDLEFKNSLLSDNLDLDYIETLIRERFLFGKKNEKIYIIKKDDTKN